MRRSINQTRLNKQDKKRKRKIAGEEVYSALSRNPVQYYKDERWKDLEALWVLLGLVTLWARKIAGAEIYIFSLNVKKHLLGENPTKYT